MSSGPKASRAWKPGKSAIANLVGGGRAVGNFSMCFGRR